MRRGFTLAELLIALAILGVIAVFTIPKVLQSQQDSRSNSIAKETAGMLSQAYQQYQLQNQVNSGTYFGNLTPFMNYVRVDTTSVIDDVNNAGSSTCGTGGWLCLQLHNGAIAYYHNGNCFGGTASTNAIFFHLDPDGTYGGSTTGPSKALSIFLYTDGKIETRASLLPGTKTCWGNYTPLPTNDPAWFSWN